MLPVLLQELARSPCYSGDLFRYDRRSACYQSQAYFVAELVKPKPISFFLSGIEFPRTR